MNKDVRYSTFKIQNGKGIWKEIYSTSEICQMIQDKVEALEDSKDYWYNQATKTKEEIRKEFEEELSEKDDELSRAPIILSSAEKKDYDAFRDFHYNKCHNTGHYILDISGGGLGWIIEIKCPICKKTKDITHSEEW